MTRRPPLQLHSRRLVVTEAQRRDAAAVAAFLARNRAFHQPWDPLHTESYYTPLGQRAAIRSVSRDGAGVLLCARLADDPRGSVIALVVLSGIIRGPFRSCFLGYRIDRAEEGRGLMREALSLIFDWAFGEFGLHRIEANIMPRNLRSVGLVRRLGFRHEGRARRFLRIAGRWEDHDRYALLDEEWSAVDRTP